jgi:hypothetical protein
MSLHNTLGDEKPDQSMTMEENGHAAPVSAQQEQQELEKGELGKSEETGDEVEVPGRSGDRLGDAERGYDQENRQPGSARQDDENRNGDTTHSRGPEPSSSAAQMTPHLPAFTERPAHAAAAITSRGVEGGTLTTARNHTAYAPPAGEANVNLHAITAVAREYAGTESDPGAGYGQYRDPGQASSQAPTRRQNVACDACRARKVKCVRKPGAEQVSHPFGRSGHGAELTGDGTVRSLSIKRHAVHVSTRPSG